MKSIADGGLCHQFHYAGVVTKIISMIDETATRPHVEMMPDFYNCRRLSSIVLTSTVETVGTTSKIQYSLFFNCRGQPGLRTTFIIIHIGLHIQ